MVYCLMDTIKIPIPIPNRKEKTMRYRVLTALILCAMLVSALGAGAAATDAPVETAAAASPETTAAPEAAPAATPGLLSPLVARKLPLLGGGPAFDPANFTDKMHYEDDSIRVSIETTKAFESTCFVVKVEIGDASQMRTETAAQSWKYRRAMPGDKLSARVNAVVAINGDYYSYIGGGYMYRGGELYRERPDPLRDILFIDESGDFHIVSLATMEAIAPVLEKKIIDSFNFGPGLIINGEKGTNMREYNNGFDKLRQRVAIGQAGHLTYYLFVTEGRSDGSRGMTMTEFQEFVSGYPVINCYNLDGGNSAHLLVNHERINAVGFRDVRDINDIIYFVSTEGYEDAGH